MRDKLFRTAIILVLPILTAGASSQTAPENHTLVVAGQPGQAPVIRQNGKSYVDVEALARLTNATLSFKGNQIILTLPSSVNASAETPASAPSEAANSAFSKNFLDAGVEAISAIREWQSTITNSIQNGYPVTDSAVSPYESKATNKLRLAFVAVSTDSDRDAFQLLKNELDNMTKFSNKMLAANQNMQNISPDALKNDPLNQQVLKCSRSLVSMAASGKFQDDGSCH